MKPQYWIAAPSHAARLSRRLPLLQAQWCYCGSDVRLRGRVAKLLAPAVVLAIGEELNRAALAAKQPFLDWIADLGLKQRDAANWWASKLASKNPLETDCFLLICYARLIDQWLTHGDEPGPAAIRIIVVEDPWLLRTLKKHCKTRPQVAFAGGGMAAVSADAARRFLLVPWQRALFILWSLWSLLKVRLLFSRKAIARIFRDKQPVTLLYSWIDGRCFAPGGAFHDPYTGPLEKILSGSGQQVVRLAPLQLGARRGWLKRIKTLWPSVIPAFAYVDASDIFRAAGAWFRIEKIRSLPQLLGLNCRELLIREWVVERSNKEYAVCQLWRRAIERLASSEGGRLRCVIYPFENQPWEKMLCLAFRRHARRVSLIGYQHGSVSPLLLGYSLGKSEQEALPLPDRIVTNSVLSQRLLAQAGFPMGKLSNGGALRFNPMASQLMRQENGSIASRSGPIRILSALPISAVNAADLLNAIEESFIGPFLDEARRLRVEVTIKCHPRLSMGRLRASRLPLPPWIAVSQQPLSELIDSADIFLYAPPTASWWEACLKGLPILKFQGDGLDMDTFEAFGGNSAQVCSRQTIKAAIAKLVSDESHKPEKSIVRDQLQSEFLPPDKDLWVQLTASLHE